MSFTVFNPPSTTTSLSHIIFNHVTHFYKWFRKTEIDGEGVFLICFNVVGRDTPLVWDFLVEKDRDDTFDEILKRTYAVHL